MLSFICKSFIKKLPYLPKSRPSLFLSPNSIFLFATNKNDFPGKSAKNIDEKKAQKKDRPLKRGDISFSENSSKLKDSKNTNKAGSFQKDGNKTRSNQEKSKEKGKAKNVNQGLSEKIKKQLEQAENQSEFQSISKPKPVKADNKSKSLDKPKINKESQEKQEKQDKNTSKNKNSQSIQPKEKIPKENKEEKIEDQNSFSLKENIFENLSAGTEKPKLENQIQNKSDKKPEKEEKNKKFANLNVNKKKKRRQKEKEMPFDNEQDEESEFEESSPKSQKKENLKGDNGEPPKKKETEASKSNLEEHKSKDSIFSKPILEPSENKPTLKHFQSGLETIELPWDFHRLIKKPNDTGNLRSAVDILKFLKESKVAALVKNFLASLEENDYEVLSKILENTFFKKLHKNLEKLKAKNMKLEVINLKTRHSSFGVHNISNFFTIGVNSDRTKNDCKNNYKIVKNIIGEVPTTNIIHIKQGHIKQIKIFVQIDIVVISDFVLKLVDQDGKTLLGETYSKENDENETIENIKEFIGENLPPILIKKYEKKNKPEVQKFNHKLKLEGCIFEGDYEFFENQLQTGKLDKWSKENHLKLNRDPFYIVDFDNYMNGNELISDTIRE